MKTPDPEKVTKLMEIFETDDPDVAIDQSIRLLEAVDEMLKPFRGGEVES